MNYQFDEYGNIKPISAQALKLLDIYSAMIVFDRGTTSDNKPYWVYIAVVPSKYKEFMHLAKEHKAKRLSDYGKVLQYGFTQDVPQNIKEEMYHRYGFDEYYVESLKEEIDKARSDRLRENQKMIEKKAVDFLISIKKQNTSDS